MCDVYDMCVICDTTYMCVHNNENEYMNEGKALCSLHTHTHTYIHTFTHTHIHTYIHTYIHTHTHTHTPRSSATTSLNTEAPSVPPKTTMCVRLCVYVGGYNTDVWNARLCVFVCVCVLCVCVCVCVLCGIDVIDDDVEVLNLIHLLFSIYYMYAVRF